MKMKMYKEKKEKVVELQQPYLRLVQHDDAVELVIVNEDGDTVASLMRFDAYGCVLHGSVDCALDNAGMFHGDLTFDSDGYLNFTKD